MDRVIHFAKLPDPVVSDPPAHAAEQRFLADPPGDRNQHEQILAEDRVGEFGVDLLILAMQRDEARQPDGILEQHGKGGLVVGFVGFGIARGSGGGCLLRGWRGSGSWRRGRGSVGLGGFLLRGGSRRGCRVAGWIGCQSAAHRPAGRQQKSPRQRPAPKKFRHQFCLAFCTTRTPPGNRPSHSSVARSPQHNLYTTISPISRPISGSRRVKPAGMMLSWLGCCPRRVA